MKAGHKEFTQKEFNNSLGIVLTPSYRSYMTELDIGLDRIAMLIKKKRTEDFEKDKERFFQALQQQKRTAIYEQWARILREKAKVTINQNLL